MRQQQRRKPLVQADWAFGGSALWIALALIAANLIMYAPVWHHEFVNFDDPQYVTENPNVTAGLTWNSIRSALESKEEANWHPLTWLSHMLDVQLYGLNAGGHHFTSLLLHIMNSLLLFWLLHRMTAEMGRSAFVAAVFAVHPLHVESVAWVAERKDVLSALFGMLTISAYVEYVRQPRSSRYLLMVAFFALGLTAKPMLVTLPFLLLLLDFWPLGRVTIGTGATGRADSEGKYWRVPLRLVSEKIPLFVLTVASSMVTFIVQQQGKAVVALDSLPMSERVANALVSYVRYIAKMFWPVRLAAFYPYSRQIPDWWAILAFLGLLTISVLAIITARRFPYILVGWFWYLGTLVPVIGLVQIGSQSMADRYSYIPLIGLSLLIAWGVPDLVARSPHRKMVLASAAGLAVSLCMIVGRVQVGYWKNSLVLWEHALDVTTNNHIAHHNLGFALATLGRTDEAVAHSLEALRIKPEHVAAHTNLGFLFAELGRGDEAIAHFSEALRLTDDAEAHLNLGTQFLKSGKLDDAATHLHAAIRLKPGDASAHNNLGTVLLGQGRLSEAAAEYIEALRISPDYADARINLAALRLRQGEIDDAIRELSEVLRTNPTHPDARRMLDDLNSRGIKSGVGTP